MAAFPQPPVGAPGRRRTSRAKLAVIIIGGSLAGCFGLGLLAAGAVSVMSGSDKPASAEERGLVITIEDLTGHMAGFEPPTGGKETFHRVDHFDGSTELVYEYDTVATGGTLYLSSGVTVETSPQNAGYSYTGMDIGVGIGLGIEPGSEVVQQERNDLLTWGDQSRTALLVTNGQPVGNVFIGRRGRRIFHVLFAGVYFDEPEAFQELVTPHLEAIERYSP